MFDSLLTECLVNEGHRDRSFADEEHQQVLARHSDATAAADAGVRVAQARNAEIHAQTLAVRDRVRAALTDHLSRLDRLEGFADIAASNVNWPDSPIDATP